MQDDSAVLCPDPGLAPIRRLPIPHRRPDTPAIFPFAPVFELICPGEMRLKRNGARWDGTVARVALRLGVDRQKVYRWLHTGMTDAQADTVAIMLGLHPSLIWGDWFALAPTTEEEVVQLERMGGGRGGRQEPPWWDETRARLVTLNNQGFTHRRIAEQLLAEGLLTRGGSRSWNKQKVMDTFRYMRRQAA